MTEEEDKAIVERINETEPDFVWVGLGAPKQEKWMAAHQGRVKGMMVGVGAGFDYYAGNIERALNGCRRVTWNGCIDLFKIQRGCLAGIGTRTRSLFGMR